MTSAEKLLWARLRKNRAAGRHFRRQQIIAGFIVDFYCHSASLIIELDGSIHDLNKEGDRQRETILREMGFQILRFKNEDVLDNIEEVLSEIERWCVADLTLSPL